MSYLTYIIYSPTKNKYYIGQCQDIHKRIEDHNNSRSTFTKGVKDWKVKWTKTFNSRTEAINEEQRIKNKKSRKYIEFLINS